MLPQHNSAASRHWISAAVAYAERAAQPFSAWGRNLPEMALEVLDVVAVLPPELHHSALELSDQLAGRMHAQGGRSHFRLGAPFGSGQGSACAPHVSLFMLAVAPDEIDGVVQVMRRVAASIEVLEAEGEVYRHNPVGAPELYFRKTAEWIELQRAVIDSVEPLRRGRLREVDPSGVRIRDLLDDPGTDPARRDQLVRFGYDEVTREWVPGGGGAHDRFNPHVTLAWPVDSQSRVDLTGLPPAGEFNGPLTELAVYGMSPFGTCTTLYGTAPLRGGTGDRATPGMARETRTLMSGRE